MRNAEDPWWTCGRSVFTKPSSGRTPCPQSIPVIASDSLSDLQVGSNVSSSTWAKPRSGHTRNSSSATRWTTEFFSGLSTV
jgi:hypothetical protein